MAAYLRLSGLINFLQAWHAKIPANSEIFEDIFSSEPSVYTDIDALKRASDELSNTLQTLRNLVSVIRTASLKLTPSYHRAKNSLLAPMQLPFEILGSVFELACQPSRSQYHSHSTTTVNECRRTRLAIGSSCSHFRRVLLGTPAAWAYISVYMASDEAAQPLHPLLPLEIARGGASPVHLYVNDVYEVPCEVVWYWESVKDNVCSLRTRLQTLVITSDGSCHTPPLGFLLSEQLLPALKTLILSIDGNSSSAISIDLRGASALETCIMEINSTSLSSIICHPNARIRELEIDGTIIESGIFNLLVACQLSLDSFHWTPATPPDTNLPLPQTTPQLSQQRELYLNESSLTSSFSPMRCQMPNLTMLSLSFPSDLDFDLGTTCFPSLATIRIWSEGFPGNVEPFFRANPTITEIKTRVYVQEFVQMFQDADPTQGELLPNLHRIRFSLAWVESDEMLSILEVVRRRSKPFQLCFDEQPRYNFDEKMFEDNSDIIVMGFQ